QLGNGHNAVVFFGDGATNEGGFWESINAASLFKLPVFFVCEDNGWAVHTPPSATQGFLSLEEVARLFDCHFFTDDSNDVESIYNLTRDAKALSDGDQKPVLMHIKCCRYLEHVGIYEDWNLGYRSEAERDEWFAKDSLRVQRQRLLNLGKAEDEIVKIETEIDDSIRRSVERAAQSPIPETERLYYGVFHETH
ncbi:MAG: putative Pyruvate dehydrogenase component subunit alpha, partial [Bryobacterales bacterium]|nr:putative Pyruvate dehydrogenase component subunit alpha [Bryobacterales bacterium]